MSKTPPSKAFEGFMGWFGRQVGHVKKAVQTDPAKLPKVTYRKEKVEEAEIPNQPGVKLRRTTIDEVIHQPQLENKPPTDGSGNSGS
jgi:hypothetical protein